ALIDLQPTPEVAREATAAQMTQEELQRPFDLTRGPLLRACLLRLDAEEHILLLTMHHIVSDGWSMGVFTGELTALYGANVTGTDATLPALPIQYPDYAVWQREWLRGAVLETQMAYWKEQLADLPVLDLPTDYPRPAFCTFQGASHDVVLPATLSAGLAALS